MTVLAYLHTPIDAHYLRTLLIGLDAVVTVNDDGVLVIEVPTGAETTHSPHEAPCDCAYCRAETHGHACPCGDCRTIRDDEKARGER